MNALRILLLGTLIAPLALSAKPVPVEALKADLGEGEAAMWATRYLTRWHYKRVPLDDAMSQQILKRYLDTLDGEKLFFTQADFDAFNTYRNTLDDAIYQEDLTPAFAIFKKYREAVNERSDYARGLLPKGFEFTVDESLQVDRHDAPAAKDKAELDDLWRRRVKNDWLRLKLAGKSPEEIRKTLDKRYKQYQDRITEIDNRDVFQMFLNSYAMAIEPHTNYLGPRAADAFSIQMKLSLEGIGAVLNKEDDYTTVRTVVKGGPADKSGKIHVGDRIVAVGQGEKSTTQDVIGWRIDDVVEKIRGSKGTIVALDVLPVGAGADAKPERVEIKRDTVKLEEQAAKKSVIDLTVNGHSRKIGVITLATFYHDFEGQRRGDPNYVSSTRDVARLLRELKKDGVEGVVMDMRENGGGALSEATELSGLFIDRGPVVQVRDSTGRIEVNEDTDAGAVWDGPLAVLVNRSSASATEIFAAAMQDYGRAIILGENTFGKGTVQNLIDLDQIANNDTPKYGEVKLTIAQFFRVNGGSTQHKGVVPDVAFPATYDPKEWGESSYDNALPYTEIAAAKYSGRGDFHELVPLLSGRHEARVGKDREFQWWLDDLNEYKKQHADKTISLLETKRKAERDSLEARRSERKKERDAWLAEQAKARGEDGAKKDDKDDRFALVDDGLSADERARNAPKSDGSDDDTAKKDEKADVLLRESANVLSDAIDFLRADSKLAARVRGFALVDEPKKAM